ncbi:hypothetical protein C8J56DRAFT_112964 [Mycena floridula]|nr:hypothetical protein C8J56DRAFT_112964 [Mycena floridula]
MTSGSPFVLHYAKRYDELWTCIDLGLPLARQNDLQYHHFDCNSSSCSRISYRPRTPGLPDESLLLSHLDIAATSTSCLCHVTLVISFDFLELEQSICHFYQQISYSLPYDPRIHKKLEYNLRLGPPFLFGSRTTLCRPSNSTIGVCSPFLLGGLDV